MANITRTQIKKKLQKWIEQLNDIQLEIQYLREEVEDEVNSIEPYENKDELTRVQEARKEWLEECVSQLEEAEGYIEEAVNSLEYID